MAGSVRSASELLRQYETLRSQALEGGNGPHPCALERMLLEQQGMVAWMQTKPESVSVQCENGTPASPDLVRVLADLVIGNRLEVQDG